MTNDIIDPDAVKALLKQSKITPPDNAEFITPSETEETWVIKFFTKDKDQTYINKIIKFKDGSRTVKTRRRT